MFFLFEGLRVVLATGLLDFLFQLLAFVDFFAAGFVDFLFHCEAFGAVVFFEAGLRVVDRFMVLAVVLFAVLLTVRFEAGFFAVERFAAGLRAVERLAVLLAMRFEAGFFAVERFAAGLRVVERLAVLLAVRFEAGFFAVERLAAGLRVVEVFAPFTVRRRGVRFDADFVPLRFVLLVAIMLLLRPGRGVCPPYARQCAMPRSPDTGGSSRGGPASQAG